MLSWWKQFACLATPPEDDERTLGLSAIFAEEEEPTLDQAEGKPEIPWSELMRLHQTPHEEQWPPKPHLGRKVSMMKDQWETMMNGKDWREYNAALKRPPGQDRIQQLKEQLIKP